MKFGFILASILALLLTGCGTAENPTIISGNVTVLNPASVVTGNVSVNITSPRDTISDAVEVIGIDHVQIHEGTAFVVSDVTNVAVSGNRTILMLTPNTSPKLVHLFAIVQSQSELEFRIYESPIVSNNGTVLSVINRNRASPTTALTKVWGTPTLTNLGTQIYTEHWGSLKISGGLTRDSNEFVLKANTYYLIDLIEYSGAANQVNTILNWYIEPD